MYLHNVPTPLFLSLRCLPYSSWTEDTQTCIFSEASAQQWRLAESSVPSELDLRIEQKFDEFDKLAAAGQKLIKERHHLADIVRSFTTGVTNIFCPVDHSLWKDWLIKLFYFKNGTSLVAQTPMTQPLEETENIWQLFYTDKGEDWGTAKHAGMDSGVLEGTERPAGSGEVKGFKKKWCPSGRRNQIFTRSTPGRISLFPPKKRIIIINKI